MDAIISPKAEEVFVQALTQAVTNKEAVIAAAATINSIMTEERGENVEKGKHGVENNDFKTFNLYFDYSESSVCVKNGQPVGIIMPATDEVAELYFKRMFAIPPNHEFYCPSCDACINKVLFCTPRPKDVPLVIEPTVPVPPVTVPPVTLPPVTVPPEAPDDGEGVECFVRCSTCFSLLIQKGKDFITRLVSRVPEVPPEVPVPEPEPGLGEHSIDVTDESTTRPLLITPTTESGKGWEILKSIVYGGLAELLASLSVVTSAAGADAATLSIFALGIANLIGGLTVLTHNIRDLKASKPRVEGSERDAEEDKYYELLGRRENYYLHAFFVVLSFLIFGLVPPVVYGFSFRESDDKDLKLAAVAGASLICITLLAIAKAQTKRTTNTFMTFFTTVTFYVTSGVLASLLTYVAGAEMKKLVEQLGWFQPKPNLGFSLPHVSVENYGWGPY